MTADIAAIEAWSRAVWEARGNGNTWDTALEEQITYEGDRAETDRLFAEAGLADV